ncbi:MAG: DUF4255 domain-containing protein [Bacteroidota bacterium]
MIYEALYCVSSELNSHLKGLFNMPEDKAVLNAVLNQDGSIPQHCLNKMVMSLINLEHDTTIPYNPLYDKKGSQATQYNVPYNFNLDVLITAVFENENYDEGLKFLSQSIYFIHGKPLYTHENTPSLDPRIEQLGFELIKLSYHEEHSLWGALGAKYMPSILFKIRMLSFQSGVGLGQYPLIDRTHNTVKPVES